MLKLITNQRLIQEDALVKTTYFNIEMRERIKVAKRELKDKGLPVKFDCNF